MFPLRNDDSTAPMQKPTHTKLLRGLNNSEWVMNPEVDTLNLIQVGANATFAGLRLSIKGLDSL